MSRVLRPLTFNLKLRLERLTENEVSDRSVEGNPTLVITFHLTCIRPALLFLLVVGISLPSRRWHCLLRLHQLSFQILPSPRLCRGTNHPAPSPPIHIVDHFLRSNFSNYVKGGRTRAALSDLLGHDIFTTTSGPSSAEQTIYNPWVNKNRKTKTWFSLCARTQLVGDVTDAAPSLGPSLCLSCGVTIVRPPAVSTSPVPSSTLPNSASRTLDPERQKAPSLVDNSSTAATPKRPFATSPRRYSNTATTLSHL
ncbi:hypothetical protein BHE74_00034056 [Ensete ventricosum]|nr:hypothetical protein BHE74_00034056 [Ensete ventricosum]